MYIDIPCLKELKRESTKDQFIEFSREGSVFNIYLLL